jgi:hypothetical protein
MSIPFIGTLPVTMGRSFIAVGYVDGPERTGRSQPIDSGI